jgi:hypothetical protein
MRVFGPKEEGHPTIGIACPACGKPFAEGDYTTLIILGPGDDPVAQEKAKQGRSYNAVAAEVHAACAGAAE